MNTFAKLTEINGVQFIADSFMNDNVMGYRGKGIQAIDAGIHVKPECTLYSLGAGGCGSFNRNVFKDLDYGIEILAITPAVKPYNTIITENRFVNNAKNLRLKGSQWAMVTKNQFVLDNDALYSGYGIMVEGSRYFKIEENTFTNNMDTWAWFNNTYIDMTGLSAERIYKNTYNGSNTAAWGIGAGRRNWQLQLKCNEFNHEQDNILALAPIALDEQQGNCGGSWMNQTQLDQAPAGNIFATTCNTTNAHIWTNSSATEFEYSYHANASRREPLDNCVNDLIKVDKRDCQGSEITNACPSQLPYSGGVIIFINRIKNNTLVADSFYTHIDKGNTMGMLEYVFNTGVSAATLTDSLINASWLSDHTLSAIFQRTPALNNVQKSLVLMRNSPHTQLMRHTIEQQGLQATIDSLDNAGIVVDTATTRFEIILAINQLNYDKNIAYNEWAYQVALDSTGANYSQLIDTLKTETTISYLLKLADFYIATEQYNKADSVLLYSIIGNPVGTLMFEHSDEHLMNAFTAFLASYMQRHNLSWYDLLTPEEQGGEETYDRENLLDFMEALAGYEISASVMGQNILTMIYDTTFNELILEKDEEMLMRKAQFEDEQAIAETNEPEHDYRLKPNLFDGKLYANITLQAEEIGKLEIYNLQGVLVGNLQLVNGKNELDLTPINLPNGVYLYRVWANDEIKHSDKLIKLK